jgi:hypothetical protein
MTEIYQGTSNNIYLKIEGATADTTPSAVVYSTDPDDAQELTVVSDGPIVDDVETWVTSIGFENTENVEELTVHWEYSIEGVDGFKDDHFDVVVPLLDIGTIRDELELDSTVSDYTIVRAERRVRRIIENACGQVFAPTVETIRVLTAPSNYVRLPKHLITLDAMNLNGYPAFIDGVIIQDNGWMLKKHKQYYPSRTIKSGWPIDDPYVYINSYWRGGGYLDITGTWGWKRVPSGVQEAALILLEDRLCPETTYRDRYLKTMTAADFRFEFDPNAYVGTGNVVADHILRDYRMPNLAAIL